MKKFISLLLTAMILITNISVSNVKAEKVYKYVLTQDPAVEGGPATKKCETDKVDEIVSYIRGLNGNKYTLTLNADLVLPLDVTGRLESINVSRDLKKLTIKGNNHTIKGLQKSNIDDDYFFIVEGGDFDVYDLVFDGSAGGVNHYNFVRDNNNWNNMLYRNCTFKNANHYGLNLDVVLDLKIDDCEFLDNGNAENDYGTRSIFLFACNTKITNTKFKNNKTKRSGIFEILYGTMEISDTDFDSNDGGESIGAINALQCDSFIMNGGSIINNKGNAVGGASITGSKTVELNGVNISGNSSKYVGALTIGSDKVTIKNSKITGNTGKIVCGAIQVEYSGYPGNGTEREFTIEGSEISKNQSAITGAINFRRQGKLNIINTSICDNRADNELLKDEKNYGSSYTDVVSTGGAIYHSEGDLYIKGSKLLNNFSSGHGGAIYTEEGSCDITGVSDEMRKYDSTWKPFQNITTDRDVEFSGNKAGLGFFNPPDEYKDYTNLAFKKFSLEGKLLVKNAKGEWEHARSLLNNYDISYINKISTVAYDPNGGFGKLQVEEFKTKAVGSPFPQIKAYEVSIKSNKETKFSNGDKYFTSWNTEANGSGTTYMPGDLATIRGNLYLYAQWYQPGVTLTLDENYRGGRITDHEVEEGELIAPYLYIPRRRGYIFKGWSYDRKHLDEVKPEDRIYTDTILYAIWKKAEIEKVEETEEIRGEDHKAYIFGYPNGTVRPNGNITRAEAAAMLARLLNIEAIGSSAKPNFKDTESSWYNKAINAVVARGIMKGYPDGRFRPNAPITRAEFTQMISTIDNKPYGEAPFVDVKGHWAERAIGSEYQAKRITGYPDGLFRPDANITRAEAAVILNKIFERNYDAMSLAKCKNALMLKRFIDLDETFWGYNDMVEATNSHEYIRRYKEEFIKRLEEDWLLIKDINDIK